MPALASFAISHVSYDSASGLLAVTFRPGRTYTFYRVPPEIYHGLMSASSAGRYYHAFIRGRFGP